MTKDQLEVENAQLRAQIVLSNQIMSDIVSELGSTIDTINENNVVHNDSYRIRVAGVSIGYAYGLAKLGSDHADYADYQRRLQEATA